MPVTCESMMINECGVFKNRVSECKAEISTNISSNALSESQF